MFDSILVPLDGSQLAECVLPHAIAVGRAFRARIFLVRVLERNQANGTVQVFDLLNWQLKKTEARLYLEKIAARLVKFELQVETAVLEGLAAESILEFAQVRRVNLIILSSHGRSGISQWGISSTAQKIILGASTSVLLARANHPATRELKEQQYHQILVPLDGSQRAEYGLPMIAMLAHFHKARTHILHVVRTPEMARRMPLTAEDMELSNRINARNREEAGQYLEQVRSRSHLEGVDSQVHLGVSENAMVAVHELVEQEHIDMVALSAHGYSGNDQWPYGSMVLNFILYGKVPLLIVQDLPGKKDATLVDAATRERAEH
jgi:nucleotide-binding universal stress UspA family protein